MEEDTEYLKLPLEDRCVHKLWKARLNGYEECATIFKRITDEKAPELSKFAPLLKKFVTESNVLVAEKALEAVLLFVENAHIAGRTAADVTAGIVAKCLGSPKQKTQDKALEIIMMYCEIEKYEPVQEELMKGFSQKNPKVVVGCIKALSTALKEFGNKVISIKLLVKSTSSLLDNRDKNVREEAKKLVIEMHRWVGPSLKPLLSSLKPIQLQELEAEFEKLGGEKAVQTRFLRSQQELKEKMEQQAEGGDDVGDGGDDEDVEELDPYELMESVKILDKLDKDFFTLIEAKKWQERKQALDSLLPLAQSPKIEAGEYADLVRALKKVIGKDSNVMLVALSAQCMCGIATGLKRRFSPYAVSCIETVMGKFKEKKPFVVTALKEAGDAIFMSSSLDSLQEVLVESLACKNPQVKAETCALIARGFCYCTPTILNKKMLKVFITEFIKLISDPDAQVRENSAEAIGTALRIVGEKNMSPFICDIEPLKMQKIKEFCDKAEIKVKITQPSKPKPPPPAKEKVVKGGQPKVEATGPPKVPNSGAPKKPGSAQAKGRSDNVGLNDAREVNEYELSLEDAIEKASEVMTEDVIKKINDTNWKLRVDAMDTFNKNLQSLAENEIPTQALVKTLCGKSGLKDNNIQVMKLKLDAIKYLAEHSAFSRTSGEVVLQDLVDRLADPKNGAYVGEVITSITERITIKWVGIKVLEVALSQKNPKILEMSLKWLSEAIGSFGFEFHPKFFMGQVKKALSHTNPGVRTAAISLCGTIHSFLGPEIRSFVEDEKAAILQQLDAEFEKPSSKYTPVEKPVQTQTAKPRGPPGKSAGATKSAGRGPGAEKNPPSASNQSRGLKKPTRPLSATRGGSAKKAEEINTDPLLKANNLKQQRMSDEHKLRTLKWEFTTPRPELITQLQDQMSNAGLNCQLMEKMFHVDFKLHLKALDSLIEDLNSNLDACIANLDLLLRWLSIRFSDTNPSVILKAMDYLRQVFTLLSEDGYNLTDFEAKSFLPFLIMKLGDPKEAIRNQSRSIITLICSIYPSSKVSVYILDGLKSKNARLRAECLECMGSLIEDYGMSVCQPSVSAALKEIARRIADRDNGVRNGALNALVQVYFREGDRVYKLIGQISDKDMSLLEERIKRSSKMRPQIKKPVDIPDPTAVKPSGIGRINRVIPTPAAQPAPTLRENTNNVGMGADLSAVSDKIGRVSNTSGSEYSSGHPFIQIDYKQFERLLDDQTNKFQLEEIPDISSILNDKPTCPVINSRLVRPGFSSAMRANVLNANVDFQDSTQAINLVVSQIASQDVNTIITALCQLDTLVQSDERRTQLQPHVNQVLTFATVQFRQVLTMRMEDERIDKDECIRIYRSLINCLTSIFDYKSLGTCAKRDVLHDVIHIVINILLDRRLDTLGEGPLVIRALNVLVVRIIERAHFTHVFSALLRLLQEECGSVSKTKFTDLVMKCSWKAIRIIPKRSDELELTRILQDAHDFMTMYPSASWINRPSDTPLRTIKTVVHTLVKTYGRALVPHLNKIPNIQGSELQKYLLKDLDNCAKTNPSNTAQPATSNEAAPSPRKLSRSANNTLSDIFRKIGSKENTKEGLVQLYEFKKSNPDADIESYLRKSSPFFQNYIERGLKKVEMEKQNECKMSISASSDGSTNSTSQVPMPLSENKKFNVNDMVDQFKEIAAQAGFGKDYIDTAVKDICAPDPDGN